MKKPTLCCCFTWIIFIDIICELNFTVAYLLITKTRFDNKVERWGILRNEG